ncbi:MAG: insulinase family protein [bacterium]|nr:insulinase family protein [bacterium]
MKNIELKNGIKTCIKVNNDTPRIALSLNLSINLPEKYAGQYLLMNNLLLKGTKKYSSEELATVLDENAIDFYTEMKYDYLRFRFVVLNEDLELALSILSDVMHNSTFEEFEKEKVKLTGELTAELDSAKVSVSDLFTKTIYENHYYGNSYTKILEEIGNVTFEDVKNSYNEILNNSDKVLTLVGDIDCSEAESLLNKYLSDIPTPCKSNSLIPLVKLNSEKYVEIIKEDAQQAQIIRGWSVPTIDSEDFPAIMLLNVILGSSGLSSRLFLELREKKGLAYAVRSSYEMKAKSATFNVYIGTEPSNIQTTLNGFNEEFEKIKNIAISEEELNNAKNNLIGKQQFISETNSQQANLMAYYAILGYSFDYNSIMIEKLKAVTVDDIKNIANKIFNENFVTAIIKP